MKLDIEGFDALRCYLALPLNICGAWFPFIQKNAKWVLKANAAFKTCSERNSSRIISCAMPVRKGNGSCTRPVSRITGVIADITPTTRWDSFRLADNAAMTAMSAGGRSQLDKARGCCLFQGGRLNYTLARCAARTNVGLRRPGRKTRSAMLDSLHPSGSNRGKD